MASGASSQGAGQLFHRALIVRVSIFGPGEMTRNGDRNCESVSARCVHGIFDVGGGPVSEDRHSKEVLEPFRK